MRYQPKLRPKGVHVLSVVIKPLANKDPRTHNDDVHVMTKEKIQIQSTFPVQ